MTQQKREDLIKSFSAPVKANKKLKKGEKPPPSVMLISLKVSTQRRLFLQLPRSLAFVARLVLSDST
jgi:hypothetical protein